MYGCMAAQVKVRERGLGLLRPMLTLALSVTSAPLKANAQMRRCASEPNLSFF